MKLFRFEAIYGPGQPTFRVMGNGLPPNQRCLMEEGNYLQVIDMIEAMGREEHRFGGERALRARSADVEALLRGWD